MKSNTFESLAGKTVRITLEDETYVIVNHKGGETSEAIEINLKKRLIAVYDDESWAFLPMSREQKFDPDARLIDHIDKV